MRDQEAATNRSHRRGKAARGSIKAHRLFGLCLHLVQPRQEPGKQPHQTNAEYTKRLRDRAAEIHRQDRRANRQAVRRARKASR